MDGYEILFAVCVLFLAVSTGQLIEEIETVENLRLRDAKEEPFTKPRLLVVYALLRDLLQICGRDLGH